MFKKRKHNSRILKKKKRVNSSAAFRLLKRAGLVIGVLTICLWLGAWVWFGGAIQQGASWVERKTVSLSKDTGFQVDELLVEGRSYLDAETIVSILDVEVGQALFLKDLDDLRMRVEALEWVESANIQRRAPNQLYVKIKERVPVALWKNKSSKKLFLIDRGGHVIDVPVDERFKGFLIVTGEGGESEVYGLIAQIRMYPEIHEEVDIVKWVGKRRWDLTTKQGIKVQMPADDLDYALSRLEQMRLESKILSQPLETLDLRQADRTVAMPREGHALEYEYVAPVSGDTKRSGHDYEL